MSTNNADPSVEIAGTTSARSRYRLRCSQLVSATSTQLTPIRFVAACRKGHIQDIDWPFAVHGSGAKCGEPLWLEERGTSGDLRPKLIGLGSPNTLRHTTSTEMHRRGVPEAQIETAAGHRGDGTNKRHYRHLRPEYLTQFIDGVESFWTDVGKLTQVHLRYQRDTKIVDLAPARRAR